MASKQQKETSKAKKKNSPRLKLVHPVKTKATSKYRSKFEAGVAASLNQRRVPFQYETLCLDYVIEAQYKPDFILPNGVIVETKGFFKANDRRKMIAVKKQHPDLDIRLVFQNSNDKISRSKKSMTYGQWATRHGFKWSSGFIPNSWYTRD
jgi:hypothetical protein